MSNSRTANADGFGRPPASPRKIGIGRGADARFQSATSSESAPVSKVTGRSLQSSLHEGFIELVEGLDSVGNALGDRHLSSDDPATLMCKTKSLLQTKGTQAVYWMQLMKEICNYTSNDLIKKAAALRARVTMLCAHEGPSGTLSSASPQLLPVDAALPSSHATVRLLFGSYQDGILELSGLQKAIGNYVTARDALWEAQVAKLHVYYGRIIDRLKFSYYKDVEEAGFRTTGAATGAAAGPALQLSGFNVNELLDKLGPGGEEEASSDMPGVERTEHKERYLATADRLRVIIPPKLATIDMPGFPHAAQNSVDTQVASESANWWKGSHRPAHAGAYREAGMKLHLAIPQAEVAIPSHVIDRYARELLYKGCEIVPAGELAGLRERTMTKLPVSVKVLAASRSAERLERTSGSAGTANSEEINQPALIDGSSDLTDHKERDNAKESADTKREHGERGSRDDRKEKDERRGKGAVSADKKKAQSKASRSAR